MNVDEAYEIVEGWELNSREVDIPGCVEDIEAGWDPETQKDQIIERNTYTD